MKAGSLFKVRKSMGLSLGSGARRRCASERGSWKRTTPRTLRCQPLAFDLDQRGSIPAVSLAPDRAKKKPLLQEVASSWDSVHLCQLFNVA